MNPAETAKHIIQNNAIMVLSTADESGKPWISPVGFVYDDDYNLYWVSAPDARHSQNVKVRPQIAVVIFATTPEKDWTPVYIDAVAHIVEDPAEIQVGIDLFAARRPQPERYVSHGVADLTGDAPQRLYKLESIEFYLRAESQVSGRTTTIREIVEL